MTQESLTRKPFILNRRPQAYIAVYGDDPDKKITKLLWSYLVSMDIEIKNYNKKQDFIDNSSGAILRFVISRDRGFSPEMAGFITDDSGFASETAVIMADAEAEHRMEALAAGYDLALNLEMLKAQSFQSILRHRIARSMQRQTSQIMQDEYLRFREALKASPDAFIVFDADNKIFFVSEHYKRAYPRIADKMVRGLPVLEAFDLARKEQGVGDLDPRYPEMREFWGKLEGQIIFRTGDGASDTDRAWQIKAAPLGEGMGKIVVTTDITESERYRKKLEEQSVQLHEALEKEKESSSIHRQFIGLISHEFRTPMTIIDGNAQILMRHPEDAENVRNRCKTIRSAVSRLVNMMESVLSSNMLKTGTLEASPESFNIQDLITELCQEQATLDSSCKITTDFSGLHDPVVLDRKMMILILSNLMSNAVKFSGSMPPDIHITATTRSGETVITVQDHGIGIPENEIDRVFDRYYRASTSSGVPGTGIGLSLVQELLKIQGGRIDVESRMGDGTTFTILLRNLN